MGSRDEELDKEIGARIRQLLEERGASQADLGRLLERKQASTNAYKYVTGRSGLDIKSIKKIAEHFDVSTDQLIRGIAPKGVEPLLEEADLETLFTQLRASPLERDLFAQHLRIYTQHRVTSSYVTGFLLGHRMHGTLQGAVDAAVLEKSREAAIAETGSAKRAEPNALRKRRARKR